MFRYLYEWAENLAFFLILTTAVFHALPGSDYKKYIRFFTGMILILMILTPVLQLFGKGSQITNFYKSREYERKIEEIENAAKYIEDEGAKKAGQNVLGEEEDCDIRVGEIRIER